jgi:hypothetical protein
MKETHWKMLAARRSAGKRASARCGSGSRVPMAWGTVKIDLRKTNSSRENGRNMTTHLKTYTCVLCTVGRYDSGPREQARLVRTA